MSTQTQVEKTEAAIKWAMSNGLAGNPVTPGLLEISRALARKLDAVKASIADYNKDCDCWKSDGPCASCYASSSLLRQFKNIVEDTAS